MLNNKMTLMLRRRLSSNIDRAALHRCRYGCFGGHRQSTPKSLKTA